MGMLSDIVDSQRVQQVQTGIHRLRMGQLPCEFHHLFQSQSPDNFQTSANETGLMYANRKGLRNIDEPYEPGNRIEG